MRFDLHNHSVYSDGLYKISELYQKAKEKDVTAFALTDHDSVLGLLEAKKYKDKIIFGIELSTSHKGTSVHIIGLFKNQQIPNKLIEFSKDYIKIRQERAVLMSKKLKEYYNINLNIDELLALGDNAAITRGNMITNIMKNNDVTLDEARKYISHDSKAYVHLSKFSVSEGIKFLKENNCFTILAHPVLLKEEILEEIIDLGFDAIEAYYPKNTKEDTNRLIELARKHNLLISAGSDFHGDLSHSDMGTSTICDEDFSKINQYLNFKVGE